MRISQVIPVSFLFHIYLMAGLFSFCFTSHTISYPVCCHLGMPTWSTNKASGLFVLYLCSYMSACTHYPVASNEVKYSYVNCSWAEVQK